MEDGVEYARILSETLIETLDYAFPGQYAGVCTEYGAVFRCAYALGGLICLIKVNMPIGVILYLDSNTMAFRKMQEFKARVHDASKIPSSTFAQDWKMNYEKVQELMQYIQCFEGAGKKAENSLDVSIFFQKNPPASSAQW